MSKIKNKLLEEKHHLQKMWDDLESQDPKNIPGRADDNTEDDDAQDIEEQTRIQALKDNISDRLSRIGITLQKIDAGTYGVCDRCGKQIDPARLEAEIATMYCIECAQKLEK